MSDRHIPEGFEEVQKSNMVTVEQLTSRSEEQMRLSGRTLIHFENGGESIVSFDTTMALTCAKPKQRAFVEPLTVGEEWEDLPLGFLRQTSMIALSNTTGRVLLENPTFAQLKEFAAAVIELQLPAGDILLVRPKTYTVIQPQGPLKIRCQHGTASYNLFAVPEIV